MTSEWVRYLNSFDKNFFAALFGFFIRQITRRQKRFFVVCVSTTIRHVSINNTIIIALHSAYHSPHWQILFQNFNIHHQPLAYTNPTRSVCHSFVILADIQLIKYSSCRVGLRVRSRTQIGRVFFKGDRNSTTQAFSRPIALNLLGNHKHPWLKWPAFEPGARSQDRETNSPTI